MRNSPNIRSILARDNPTRSELMRLVIWLSIPTLLAELASTFMEYIDAGMVGSLGAQATASIGLVASSTWLMGGLCGAASVGFSVQVAQFIGAGRYAEARNVFRQSLVVSMIFSVFIACIGAIVSQYLPAWLGSEESARADASAYFFVFSVVMPTAMMNRLCTSMLQCSGNMRVPSMLNVLLCLLDVVFNFFLIFPTRVFVFAGHEFVCPGAGLGVVGAALGTAAAEVVVGVLFFVVTCVRSPILGITGRYRIKFGHAEAQETWRLQPTCLITALTIALPVAAERVIMNGAQIVTTGLVAPLGNVSVAAHSLAITVEGVCYMPGFGVSAAATTLVGQSFGAGRRDLAKRVAYLSTAFGMAVMTCAAAILFVLAPSIFGILTSDPAVREMGSTALRIELFAEPLFAASIVAAGAMRGVGDTLVPTIINLSTMWGIRITLAIMLVSSFGLYGVWVAMLIELCIRGTLMLVRLGRGAWLKRASVV